MGNQFSSFYRFLFFLFLISLISAGAVLLGVSSQFFVWEFSFDGKVMLFALLLVIFIRKYLWSFSLEKYGAFHWDFGVNILAFLFPIVILVLTICTGYLMGKITFEGGDDAATLLLATLFDIPAAYVFSIAIILVEELIFRGFVFEHISQENGIFKSALITSMIWTVANADKFGQVGSLSFYIIFAELLNVFSIGLLCSAVYCHTKSIWPGYSFRIGLLVFSSAMLASDVTETSGVFYTEVHALSNNGLLFSVIAIIFASCLFIFSKKGKIPQIPAI